MTHQDFAIGHSFWTAAGEFRCTDIGTRVIVAMKVTDDPSWLNGPPYAAAEIVFDEYDFEGCFPTEAELLADQADQDVSNGSA